MLCRADGRDRIAGLATIAALFHKQGISPLRRRQGGNGNRRSLRSPPCPLRVATNEVDFFESSIKVLTFRSSGDFRHAIMYLGKRGFSGDLLRARNAVGEGRHPRGRKRRGARRQVFAALRAENQHNRTIPRRGVYAAVRGWEIARSGAASAGKNDDDGSKIPGGVQPRPHGQLDEAGCFLPNMVRRCLLCQRNCAARFRAGFWHF